MQSRDGFRHLRHFRTGATQKGPLPHYRMLGSSAAFLVCEASVWRVAIFKSLQLDILWSGGNAV